MTGFAKFSDPRLVPALLLAASSAILGAALLSQYWGGLQPCVLCLYQRLPYAVAIPVAATALALGIRPEGVGLSRWLVYVCGLLFLANAGIAFFHVGVEQHWWEGTAACGGGVAGARSLAELEAQLAAAPIVRCDVVAWSLFGVSMAGYNVLASLALAAFSFLGPGLARRGQHATLDS